MSCEIGSTLPLRLLPSVLALKVNILVASSQFFSPFGYYDYLL